MKIFLLFEVMCCRYFDVWALFRIIRDYIRIGVDTFNFLFSGISVLLLWSDILVLRVCVDPMYTFLHFLHSTPQDTNCTATCLLSRKLFKLDKPDMQDTAGEAGTNS